MLTVQRSTDCPSSSACALKICKLLQTIFFLKRTDFVYLYCFNFMISQNKETTFLDFVERTKSFLNCDCVELKAYLGLSILIYTYISAFRISCGCDFQWTFLLNRKNKQEKENLNLVLRLINLEHFQCKKK